MSAQSLMNRRRWLVFVGCVIILVLSGWLDYATGYEMGFFVFYSLPVGLTAWYIGKWPAILIALGASLTWWLADRLAGQVYSSTFSLWWNNSVHFSSFLINAVTISKIKTSLDARHQLENELVDARGQIQVLIKNLSICPKCGQPRESKSPRQDFDASSGQDSR